MRTPRQSLSPPPAVAPACSGIGLLLWSEHAASRMPGLKKILILLFTMVFLIGFFCPAQASVVTIDPLRQEAFADQLFKNGQYLRAAEEYQRFAFFFKDHPKNRLMQFNAGKSFMLANDPLTALKIFKSLTDDDRLDDIAVESHFMAAQCHLQMNAFTQALVQLSNLIALSDSKAIKDRAYYRTAWIHIDRMDWPGALGALDRMTPEGRRQYNTGAIAKPLEQAGQIPQKSPSTAGALSIIPGAGQLYCHRYKDALIAFVLNVGTFWAAHDAFENDQVGLGSLLSFVGLGFYAGNIYGAFNDAHKFNSNQKRHFVDYLKQQPVRPDFPPQSHRGGIVIGARFSF